MKDETISDSGTVKIGFFSLPREVRDQIYDEVFITSDNPVRFDHMGLHVDDTNFILQLALLAGAMLNFQFTLEACERFCRGNAFELVASDLTTFFSSDGCVAITADSSHPPLIVNKSSVFRQKVLVRALHIRLSVKHIILRLPGPRNRPCVRYLSPDLRQLLDYQHLQTITVLLGTYDWSIGDRKETSETVRELRKVFVLCGKSQARRQRLNMARGSCGLRKPLLAIGL